ncbi:hypothetical protein Q4485_07215 [Granulosicoccaceae sp. 1_MG-2023]|nr:hypothetical protein [Granulosicoccaceae sp. 1_MG-2023]
MARQTPEALKVREARLRWRLQSRELSLENTVRDHPLATAAVVTVLLLGLRRLPALSKSGLGLRLLSRLLR